MIINMKRLSVIISMRIEGTLYIFKYGFLPQIRDYNSKRHLHRVTVWELPKTARQILSNNIHNTAAAPLAPGFASEG